YTRVMRQNTIAKPFYTRVLRQNNIAKPFYTRVMRQNTIAKPFYTRVMRQNTIAQPFYNRVKALNSDSLIAIPLPPCVLAGGLRKYEFWVLFSDIKRKEICGFGKWIGC
ncbi:MAG: hypothetical protein ABI723_13030, partial [Bacteroidia bacterium]